MGEATMRAVEDAPSRRWILAAGSVGAATTAAGVLAGSRSAEAQTPDADSIFNVKDAPFNATGDGTTDDTAAIQAAINAALSTAAPRGGGIVWLPAGAYKISGALRLNGTNLDVFDKPVSLQGVGDASCIKVTGEPGAYTADGAAIIARGRDETKVALGAAAAAGARQLTVPAAVANALAPGSIIGIEEDVTTGFVYGIKGKPRELRTVIAKNGTTIDLDSPLLFSYTANAPGAVVWKMTPAPAPSVRNLSVTYHVPTTPTTPGTIYSIRFKKAANIAIENVTVFAAAGGIAIQDAVDGHVTDCTIDRLPPGKARGYGVSAIGGTANVTIVGLVGRGTRHLFTTLADQRGAVPNDTFWGGPRDVTIVGGIGIGAPGAMAIWDSHEYGSNIHYVGCTARGAGTDPDDQVNGASPGFQVRARDVMLTNCVAVRCNGRGVNVNAAADNVTIHGGEFAYNGSAGIAASAMNTRVINAHVHNNGKLGIGWGGAPTSVHILGCHIHDNGKAGGSGAPYGIQDTTTTQTATVVIAGNVIPWSSTQSTSMLGVKGAKLAISNNVLLGYTSGDKHGDVGTAANARKLYNTTDP